MSGASCGNERHPDGPWHPSTPLPPSWDGTEYALYAARRAAWGCGCAPADRRDDVAARASGYRVVVWRAAPGWRVWRSTVLDPGTGDPVVWGVGPLEYRAYCRWTARRAAQGWVARQFRSDRVAAARRAALDGWQRVDTEGRRG